jgi:hypothetical protein
MSTTTKHGRAALAQMLKDRLNANTGFMALGVGQTWWGKTHSETVVLTNEIGQIAYPPDLSEGLTVQSASQGITYGENDFRISSDGTITALVDGNITFGQQLYVTYKAIIPPVAADAAALSDEIGRARITSAVFVEAVTEDTPANARQIKMGQVTLAVSDVPTGHLLIEADVSADDAPNRHIREQALFINCQLVDGLPPGQTFFTSDQFADTGLMFVGDTHEEYFIGNNIGMKSQFLYEI